MLSRNIFGANMGQYFKCINLDKQEFLEPNSDLKLHEWTTNLDESGLITTLLMDRWAGDILVLLGEYDDSKEFNGLYEETKKNENWNIFQKALKLFKRKEIQNLIESKKTLYLVNKSDNVYIKGSFKQISICLPLLLRQSIEGGDGGGDIYKDYQSAGIFVGKSLYITDEKSEIEGFKDISAPVFKDAFDFYNS